ncbi:methyl-CpG-binding domain-containing protein 9 [Dorcoceras hygrometricum]|uniref:Methyl-CpG-binding domain-containing protein 9 n=1 Tax=Dorcoceras hygrometricum TaxID=472368 RepID=A0A2Z7CA00_9LAMI|nr:methyl-CpG-binding domain-containing protein 9 [Dorcoceras hygrometricum]
MENRNSFGDLNSNVGVSKPMAFLIDLNETPIVSPRERDGTVSICSVCGREVAAGKTGVTKDEQWDWKCFRCLLQNGGASSSGGAGAGLDINASPPRETEGDHPAHRLGGGREFRVGGVALACHSALRCPQIPNMLYLQTLRRYIVERKGVLGEGWHVEFDFCNRRFRTSAVYVAPDGRRFKSMEDVASHLGIPLSFHNAGQKEFSAFASSQDCRQPELHIQKLLYSGNGSHDGFPIQFQDFCLLSAGNIDPRPAYHNTDNIWPVGYRCSWHDKITGSLFVCGVSDGGECGPIFKVHRFPCNTQFIPVGSAVLSRANSVPSKGDDKMGLDELTTSPLLDDDDLSIITLINEHSPCLDICDSTSKKDNVVYFPEQDNSSSSNVEFAPQQDGSSKGEVAQCSVIGEFQLEARSSSSVWERVSEAFVNAFREMFKQTGAVRFFCGHDTYEMNNENLDSTDSLSRYSYWGGPMNVPRMIQNERDFNMACELLLQWLKQDRFGFNVDFVQEIIEQLPGVSTCSEYKNLKDRKQNSSLQSVGSGFLQVEQNTNSVFRTSKRWRLQSGGMEKFLTRDPCPPGNPLSTSLPSYLIGDALQAWELAWRFVEVLGIGQPFSFQDLESELLSPSIDCCALNIGHETVDIDDDIPLRKSMKVSQARLGRYTGFLLVNIYGLLLRILVSELLSKVVAYACPNSDSGEPKPRRGRKKDLDCSAALKKTQFDVLPVNELTWPEIARRYILSVFVMEGNLDSSEIASRESWKVFHCLRGDGGVLCGSLSGIAALEGDAVVLADSIKEIFGPLKCKIEIVGGFENESEDDGTQTIEAEDGAAPEWAQVLEPVRKLPTNVGARIRRCVNEALLKDPPEWAKKMLEHSISKEVYKGNASGPTKRAVISVLDKVSSDVPQQQKTEKKEKVKSKVYLTDLVNKQCRMTLRHAVATDEDRVFCNLLGRATLNPNDPDDEGLLGYPAMVSRPLDFRTIDLRLATGAYDGSHEAFIDDVREVWRNIRTAYGDRSDLIKLAENLSQKFEELYEKEVLALVDKIAEFQDLNGKSADVVNEREDLLANVMKSSLPRAPWEEGICKVCGMDKDDDNVLLCDRCDSEYHRYCLNPPLLRIPKGNWYCPSCVSGHSHHATYGSVAKQPRKNGAKGEFKRKFSDSLARLAHLMEIKEYWEFTLEERIFFTKFLFDEALNSAIVRNHMDQCAFRPADLQNRLRSLAEELQIQKFKEETLVLNIAKTNSTVSNILGDLKSDASSSLVNVENNSRSKTSDAMKQPQYPQLVHKDSHGSIVSSTQVIPGHNLSGSTSDLVTEHESRELQDNVLKLVNIRNTISNLLESIASVESEILKASLRKDFLGRDSNGRAYWVFYWPRARPWIIANGTLSFKKSSFEEFMGIPDSDKWMLYEFDSDIERLIEWLNENNTCEKELKESILQLKSNKLKDSEYAEKHILCRGESSQLISGVKRKAQSSNFLATKAMGVLEKRFGSCSVQNPASGASQNGQLYRCECLEMVWVTKDHCPSCHQSFPTSDDLRKHAVENCNTAASVTRASQTVEDISKHKKLKKATLPETLHVTAGIHQVSTSEKQNCGSSSIECPQEPDFPFKIEEIMARFNSPNSLKDSVTEIGLIGSGGVPSFIPNNCTNLSDPALRLASTRINMASLAEIPSDLRSWPPYSNNEDSAMEEGSGADRVKYKLTRDGVQISTMKDSSSELGAIMLDIDAALPEDALRNSRTNQEKRRAWREFVKSAKTIYEMVQALIVLEDAIKSEYLHGDWWYWSSPSTAAKITTLSALSLRIYSLDSAISYEKPFSNCTRETIMPKAALDEDAPQKTTNLGDQSSPPQQKIAEPEPTEVPRTRSRSSKRRKNDG